MNRYSILVPLLALCVPFAAAAGTPQPAPDCTSYADADRAACELAAALEADFIYPEQGARYAVMLREQAAAHAYAGLSREEAARRMTGDLLAVSPDGHLRVEPTPDDYDAPPPPADGDQPAFRSTIVDQAWLAPGVAYVRFDGFDDAERNVAETRRFFADHADARALIIDLRANGGGHFGQLDAIMPWLYAEPTRLVAMANRKHVDEITGGFLPRRDSLRAVPDRGDLTVHEHWSAGGEHAGLQHAPIYVLTSNRTGSAGEHLAFALKITRRGVLVGHVTAGANHFGGMASFHGGLSAFIPMGRTYDPVTDQDWEGHGVAPDIAVEPAAALALVLRELGLSESDAEKAAALHTPPAEAMERWHPGM